MANAPIDVKRSTPAPDVFRSFRADMDRLFDRFAGTFGLPSLARLFDTPAFSSEGSVSMSAPAVDITEDDGSYRITAELPGLSEKDVEVTVSGDRLTLKGEKRQETERKEANYHLTERSWGAFQRSFMLPPDVDREKINAEFSKGVLTVTLAKTAQAQQQQKKIEVKSAA